MLKQIDSRRGVRFGNYGLAYEEIKGWGKEFWVHNNEDYCAKVLVFESGKQTSLHYHCKKKETMIVIGGLFEVVVLDTSTAKEETICLGPGDFITLESLVPHQIKCVTAGSLFEASTKHDNNDSYRIKPGDSQSRKFIKKIEQDENSD